MTLLYPNRISQSDLQKMCYNQKTCTSLTGKFFVFIKLQTKCQHIHRPGPLSTIKISTNVTYFVSAAFVSISLLPYTFCIDPWTPKCCKFRLPIS